MRQNRGIISRQGRKIDSLATRLKILTHFRLSVLSENPLFRGIQLNAIFGREIRTIELAIDRARYEAASYQASSIQEFWDDFWRIPHLPEHKKALHLLQKFEETVRTLELTFGEGFVSSSHEDIRSILFNFKGQLEVHPDLLACESYG